MDSTFVASRLLAVAAELLGIGNKGVDGLWVRWDGCVSVIWEWRRHIWREGRKGRGDSSSGVRILLLLLVCGYPLSHSGRVDSATIFGDMVAGVTLGAADLSGLRI